MCSATHAILIRDWSTPTPRAASLQANIENRGYGGCTTQACALQDLNRAREQNEYSLVVKGEMEVD